MPHLPTLSFFFFNDTATTEIYTLSLHDALPISTPQELFNVLQRLVPRLYSIASSQAVSPDKAETSVRVVRYDSHRSEEHTSELQSPDHLVCRLLLEKKKKKKYIFIVPPVTPLTT